MKHIFLIHSHTLFLTSLGVIEKEKLPKEDVIFVYSRNYKCILDIDYKSYDFSDEIEKTYYIMLSWSRKHFLVDKKVRRELLNFFDSFLNKQCSEGFSLYVCHLQAFANQIFATNELCRECFFIQEGGRVMTPDVTNRIKWFCSLYNKLFLKGDKRLWKMTNWFPNETTPYKKPIVAYAFDNKYFGSAPAETRMIKWPKIDIDIKLDVERPFFLLEGAVELGQVERSLYEAAVKKIVCQYAKEKNYIKFHPQNSDEVKRKYISYFKEIVVDVEELPMNVPFELILLKFKNLYLYGFGTSLLFYGKALGHHVISHEEYLMSSARYRAHVKGLQTLEG